MSKHKKTEETEAQNAEQSCEQKNEQVQNEGSTSIEQNEQCCQDTQKALEETQKALIESQTKISDLETEVSSLKDQYLRKLADFENFRKRMFREKDDAVQYANTQILTDLVQVLDDFDRALLSSVDSNDVKSLRDGINMIHTKLLGLLETKYGLAHYDSVGQAFDPNIHEAMLSEQGDCCEPTVIEEFVKGYKIRERVLRSAKVKVQMPSADKSNETASNDA